MHIRTHVMRLLSMAAALCLALPAQADPVNTVPGGLVTSVLSFSPYDAVNAAAPVPAPIDVGLAEGLESVLLTFDDPDPPRILGAVATALGGNGSWPYQGAFAGLNVANGVMTLSFARGMNFVGGMLNYDPNAYDGTPVFVAFGQNGAPLESIELSFNFGDAGATGQGAFLGFSRPDADIWGVRLENGKAVIDNLNFGVAVIPEPGSWMLLLAGLGLLLARRPIHSRSSA